MKLAAFCLAVITAVSAFGAWSPDAAKTNNGHAIPEGIEASDWSGIRAAYDAGRHEIRAAEGGHAAKNPGMDWMTTWDGRGFLSQPRAKDANWTWGLELAGYGFPGNITMPSGVPSVEVKGQRLSYRWDSSLEEWYINDQRGVEHGFIVAERPAGNHTARLTFTMKVRGGLRPEVSENTKDMRFLNAASASVVTYSGLKVWDADGKILPAHFEAAEEGSFQILVDERGARYPLTVDPVARQAYLKASNTGAGDIFGRAVAVDGNTVVISAALEDSSTTGTVSTPNEGAVNSGAVYVFVRSSGFWTQQAYLKASNTGAEDYFGHSVAISGDTIVVGADREDSSATGTSALLSAGGDNTAPDSGAVYVFTRVGSTWTQQAYIKASNTGIEDRFGVDLAISGDTIVVGAYGEASNATTINAALAPGPGTQSDNSEPRAGAAYVFKRTGSTWSQQAYLKASNGQADDRFCVVDISGDTIVVGAVGESSDGTGASNNSAYAAGAAYVFVRSGNTWTQQAYLKASNAQERDALGMAVAITGDTLVVGAWLEDGNGTTPADNSIPFAGAAYVFQRTGVSWSQQAYLKASNPDEVRQFGGGVAISGNTIVVISQYRLRGDLSLASGAAFVFVKNGSDWIQQSYLEGYSSQNNDGFGTDAVGVSGNTIVVGAFTDNSSTTGINSAPNELAEFAGAAYVFTFTPDLPVLFTQAATALSATGRTLRGTVYARYSTTTPRFEWGIHPSGTIATVSPTIPASVNGNAEQAVSFALSGLSPGQTYRFRILGSNVLGEGEPGLWRTFTTAPAAPSVTTLPVTGQTHTTASLEGTVSANGADTSVTFTYTGPDGIPRTVSALPSSFTTAGTPVAAEITGLLPETTYSFFATASNSIGSTNSTPVRNFTTPGDPAIVGGVETFPNLTITGGVVFGSVVQPDGGTLLFGAFTSVNGSPRNRIARLTPAGDLDTTFNPNANNTIVCAAVMNDGKIWIGGDFTMVGSTTRNRLARLNPNGTVDTTFADPAVNAFVLSLAVQADGAVLAAGDFTGFMGSTRNRVARITAAGALDASFNPNANAPVYAIAVQTDGSILLGGAFTTMGGTPRSSLAKVSGTSGSLLPYAGAATGAVYTIALQRDGRAVVGGAFSALNGSSRNLLARLNVDGSLDTGFNPNFNGEVRSTAIQTNEKIIVAGVFSSVSGTTRNKLARVSGGGVVDAFNPNVSGGDAFGVALQKNGKVHASGNFATINGSEPRSGFAVLNNETAFETLDKRSDTLIRLNRAASAPQASYVVFELSTDGGVSWSPVGTVHASASTPDFVLSGISPPLPVSGRLRARARTYGGYFNGSPGLTETVLVYNHPKPTLTGVVVSEITGNSAVLSYVVNANNSSTNVIFNYGEESAPLTDTVSGITVTGTTPTSAQLTIHSLLPGRTYRLEAVAANVGGTVTSAEIVFTTLSNLNVNYKADGSDTSPTASSYTASGRQVNFALNRALSPGTTLMVVNNTGEGPIVGTFANLAQGQPVNLSFGGVQYPYVAHYYGGTGNDLVLLWRNTRVLTWGWNNNKQLGNGGSADRGIPGDIVPGVLEGKTLVSLSGGLQHSVALCVDGTIATWGDNLESQLGNGDPVSSSSSSPVAVDLGFLPEGIHPVAVSAGGLHTLALFSNGQVYGWGDNEYGQVGSNDAPLDRSIPAHAKGALAGRRVIGISAGEYHSLAVCDDGFVAAWGLGSSGQLGNGDTANQKSPVAVDLSDVPVGEKFIAVAAGRWHSMALTSGGKVFTWGNNQSGQLGNGGTTNQNFPILVPGLTATTLYGGGTHHSLALRNDGSLVAWGTNIYGQLGTGGFVNSFTPVVVNNAWMGGQGLYSAASGDQHNLALRSDRTLFAWGLGNEGRLGNNNIGTHNQPTQIAVVASALDPGDRWQAIAGGALSQHSMGIIAVSLEPSALTLAADVLSENEVILRGLIGPHGTSTAVSFDLGTTTAYGTEILSDPALNGLGKYNVSALATGLQPGRTYHYRVKGVQTSPAASALGGDLTFTTLTRLQAWRRLHFEGTENSGLAANDADPDADGIPNLLEFAFALNPRLANAGGLPQANFAPNEVSFAFNEPNTFMGLTYTAEWSTTLATGSWMPMTEYALVPGEHLFKLNTTGLPRFFVRLVVTENAP